jgi:hypothetical protein
MKLPFSEKTLNKIKDWLWQRSAPYFDLDGYMRRRWAFVCPWFTARVHNILRSDHDRALHDHPFNYLTIILAGGYWEHLSDGSRTWYGPGSIRWAKANTLHRLELPEGKDAWSLFFTGQRIRKWGFQTEDGWKPYDVYLNNKNNEQNGTTATATM